jgi:hypothetical protein
MQLPGGPPFTSIGFFFFFLLPPGLSIYVNVEANIALKCDDPGGGGDMALS